MLKRISVALAITLLANTSTSIAFAKGWVSDSEKVDGSTVHFAEVEGDENSVFSVACAGNDVIIEIFTDDTFADKEQTNVILGVDRKDSHTLAGYIAADEKDTVIVSFIDDKDAPVAGTDKLLADVKSGNKLFILDSEDKIVEEFSLKGSTKAVSKVQAKCNK